MSAVIPVTVHRAQPALDLEADLHRARVVAKLMDAQFAIGEFRFGLDAIVGLIPGIGDAAGLVGALYPVYLVRKHGLDRKLERKMVRNIAIDFVLGLVPVAGDVFDAYFKANLKNVALLEKAAGKHR